MEGEDDAGRATPGRSLADALAADPEYQEILEREKRGETMAAKFDKPTQTLPEDMGRLNERIRWLREGVYDQGPSASAVGFASMSPILDSLSEQARAIYERASAQDPDPDDTEESLF